MDVMVENNIREEDELLSYANKRRKDVGDRDFALFVARVGKKDVVILL